MCNFIVANSFMSIFSGVSRNKEQFHNYGNGKNSHISTEIVVFVSYSICWVALEIIFAHNFFLDSERNEFNLFLIILTLTYVALTQSKSNKTELNICKSVLTSYVKRMENMLTILSTYFSLL